ncbi:MAG TPA: hypothetical protein PKW34_01855 [Candidatus Paceibacterota bacterium]|nr:hypothetical protein [Candidatus Paceibacterota bacterium]
MSFLSRKKGEGDLVALIDIGSNQISGAIFRTGQKNKTSISSSILFFTQTELSPQRSIAFKDYLKEASQALEKVLKALKASHHKPQAVFCFLSSPYFITRTKDIVWRSEQKAPITTKKIGELSVGSAKDFADKHPSLYPEILNDRTIIIENEIMSVVLDGYKGDNLTRGVAGKVEISQYVSLGSETLLGYFKNMVASFFPQAPVKFQTFTFAAYSVFKDLMTGEKDFFLIDAAGDITDILVVNDGVLAEHRSFPFGRRQILKKLAEFSGTVPAEAESLLKLLTENKTSQSANARVTGALEKIFIHWSTLFKNTISQIAETVFIPSRVYLIGYDSSDLLLADWIKRIELSKFLLSSENYLSVGLIDKKLLTYEPINSLGQVTNTFILAEALFCDKLYKNPNSFYFINSLKNMQDIVKNKKSLREIFPEVGASKMKSGITNTPPPTSSLSSRTNPSPRRRFRFAGWLVLLVVLLIVGVGGFVLSNVFARAIVNIQPKQGQLDVSGTHVATREGDEGLKFVLAEDVEEVDTATVAASGSEKVEIKASGRIVIINKDSSTSQTLVEKTRFQAPNGNIYRIAESVTVPGTHKNEKGETVPGQLEVTVYADKAGSAYNLGLADFTIPGFAKTPKFEKITAKSKTPISGGFIGERPKISEADMANLEESMSGSLQAKVIEKIKQQVPEDYVLFDDAVLTRFSTEIATSSESGSDKVAVRGKVTATGILFNRADLSQYLAKAIPGWTGEDKVDIANMENLGFTLLDKENLNPESLTSISFNLQGIAHVVWQFDENALKDDLQKADKDDYNDVFESYPEIQKAVIVFRPGWVRSVSQNDAKIEIKIEEKAFE